MADVAAFGTGPGPTQASVFGHEIVEQAAKQIENKDVGPAHAEGNAAANRISGYIRGAEEVSRIQGVPVRDPLPIPEGRKRSTSSSSYKMVTSRSTESIR